MGVFMDLCLALYELVDLNHADYPLNEYKISLALYEQVSRHLKRPTYFGNEFAFFRTLI